MQSLDRLHELQTLKYDFHRDATDRKCILLTELSKDRLPNPAAVAGLHEALCFIRAFPENATTLELAVDILERIDQRRDLERHRDALTDSGIAGSPTHFRFFWLTASWLVRKGWGSKLTIQWSEFENQEKLNELWHLLVPYSETPGLDSFGYTAEEWIGRLKAPEETDAEFLIRRFDSMRIPTPVREKLFEDLDIPMILANGPDTPARGRESWPNSPIVFQDSPPDAGRPRLREAIRAVRLQIRPVSPRDGRKLVDLANRCMVPRHRDLLIFLNADDTNVQMIDCGDGLQFACFGAIPERRLMLEAVYGFLTLMNGVPIGYVLCSAFFNSAEVAYNVFDTFRGRGAAHVYAKVLGMVHQLFGADTFAVDPYQLGHENQEGQESGAWWFYYKLGFRPHDPAIKKRVKTELAKLKRNPGYRTSSSRLNELAAEYMFLHLNKPRSDVLGRISLGNIGLRISSYLALRFGADREMGLRTCAREAATLLGVRHGPRLAGRESSWTRWAPLALSIPGVERWTKKQKSDLAKVILAKGSRQESEFVRLFDQHHKLRAALIEMAEDE